MRLAAAKLCNKINKLRPILHVVGKISEFDRKKNVKRPFCCDSNYENRTKRVVCPLSCKYFYVMVDTRAAGDSSTTLTRNNDC